MPAAAVRCPSGYRCCLQIVSHRDERWEGVHLFKFDFQALFAIPIIVFGFNCHANVVSIFKCADHYLVAHRLRCKHSRATT